MLIITGPCQLESKNHGIDSASYLSEFFKQYPQIDFVFKTSFDKGNRTSGESPRGAGLAAFKDMIIALKKLYPDLRTITDVHSTNHVQWLAEYISHMQIPAMLSRQTTLIECAAQHCDILNIKKGQFMSPHDMKHAYQKAMSKNSKPKEIWLTERGTTFGYNNLVVDFRSFMIMKQENPDAKIIFDCTHSTQLPTAGGNSSGGQRCFSLPLAKAAIATSCVDGLFLETHHDPDNAPSDGPSMIPWSDLKEFIEGVLNVS